ncbi:hypothetical protein BN2475_460063 [Paraburkholderia ribeironis]|uniref:Uncharacterized protein n=1 Tax=Paraburkholderia ribeironis TaxID=1247936 RepID=A0A1N7S9P1_9BURK|nr:hypothetical protein BN2475_460063 [Paraburkholderia ribeironis]
MCNAQKTLDIHRDHPKIGTIAAMHNTSRSGGALHRASPPTQCGPHRQTAIQERKP